MFRGVKISRVGERLYPCKKAIKKTGGNGRERANRLEVCYRFTGASGDYLPIPPDN